MGIFGMEDHSMDGLDVVKLTTQVDTAMIGLVESLLNDNGILYMLRDATDIGGLTRVVFGAGYQTAGMDFYVKREDHERAQGLLDAFVLGGGEPAEPDRE